MNTDFGRRAGVLTLRPEIYFGLHAGEGDLRSPSVFMAEFERVCFWDFGYEQGVQKKQQKFVPRFPGFQGPTFGTRKRGRFSFVSFFPDNFVYRVSGNQRRIFRPLIRGAVFRI